MWSTNKVTSAVNSATYAGATLQSGASYYWKVVTWDNNNSSGSYSAAANFSMQGAAPAVNHAPNAPTGLLCGGQTNPRGIANATPTLAWTFSDSDAGNTQSAYQILVANSQSSLNSNIGNTWNSNKVTSAVASATYAGGTLASGATYYWKVVVWDNLNSSGPFATSANFSMQGGVVQPQNPVIAISTSSLAFGELELGKQATLNFDITNTGGGILTGTIVSDSLWLTVQPASFSGNTVPVNVTADGLILKTLGDNTATLTIHSNATVQDVVINVTVKATCVLVKPNPVNAGGAATFYGNGIVKNDTAINIYSLSGELVRSLRAGDSEEVIWNGLNEAGQQVSNGIYIYTYVSPREKGVGKFTVVK
jgi:hypothetical protein